MAVLDHAEYGLPAVLNDRDGVAPCPSRDCRSGPVPRWRSPWPDLQDTAPNPANAAHEGRAPFARRPVLPQRSGMDPMVFAFAALRLCHGMTKVRGGAVFPSLLAGEGGSAEGRAG